MEMIRSEVLEGNPFSEWELTLQESFNLKEFYKRIHLFLKEEGYGDIYTGKDEFETYYYEKETLEKTKEHKVLWRFNKFTKNPGHNSIKFHCLLDFTTKFLTKKEVMVNGKKTKLDVGELKVEFSLFIDFDANKDDRDAFKSHPILKLFQNKMRTKYRRKLESLAKGEALTFSNDLYALIQVYVGVRPDSELSRKDFIGLKGATN